MPETYELLKESVHAGDYEQQRRALAQLRRMGKAATNDLIAVLSDTDPEIAKAALSRLVELRDGRAIDPLIHIMEDANSPLRSDAIYALADFDEPQAFEALASAVRAGLTPAAFIIGRLSDERAKDLLTEALGSDNQHIRMSAVSGLSLLNDPDAVTYALEALNDEASVVRVFAALALGQLSDTGAAGSEVIDPLISALSDSDPRVRGAAAGALGAAASDNVAEALFGVLQNDVDESVSSSAAWSLARIGDERALEPSISFLKHPDCNVRLAAIDAVARLRPENAATLLAAMLADENEDVRRTAVSALGFLRDPLAVGPLITALDDHSPEVAEFAIHALESLKDPKITDALVRTLHHENPQVRWAAASALSTTKDPRAVQVLMDALKAKNAPIICGAYAFYIRKAVPGCEQALINCLDLATGRRMAADLSECGNPILEQAARKWLDENPARERVMDAMAGPSRKPRWGRDR